MLNRRISPLAWLGLALVVALVLLAIFGALSMSTNGGYYGMMGSGAWGWGVLMMGVPVVLLILILFAALGGLGRDTTYAPYPAYAATPTSALEILNQRYARGELSQDEYQRIRADLSRSQESH